MYFKIKLREIRKVKKLISKYVRFIRIKKSNIFALKIETLHVVNVQHSIQIISHNKKYMVLIK